MFNLKKFIYKFFFKAKNVLCFNQIFADLKTVYRLENSLDFANFPNQLWHSP